MSEKQLRTNSRNKMPKWLAATVALPIGLAALAGCSGNTEAGDSSDNKELTSFDISTPKPITNINDPIHIEREDGQIKVDALMATQDTNVLCKMGIDGINSGAQFSKDIAEYNLYYKFSQTQAFKDAIQNPSATITYNDETLTNAEVVSKINWNIRDMPLYMPYEKQMHDNTSSIDVDECIKQYDPNNATLSDAAVSNPNLIRVIKDTELLDPEMTFGWQRENVDYVKKLDDEITNKTNNNTRITDPQNFAELDQAILDNKHFYWTYVAGTHRA